MPFITTHKNNVIWIIEMHNGVWKVNAINDLKTIILDAKSIGLRALNCLECMKVPIDTRENIPSLRLMLINAFPDKLLKHETNIALACEFGAGYILGLSKIISLAVSDFAYSHFKDQFFYKWCYQFDCISNSLLCAKPFWSRFQIYFEVAVFLIRVCFCTSLIFCIGTLIPKLLFLIPFLSFIILPCIDIFEPIDGVENILMVDVLKKDGIVSVMFSVFDSFKICEDLFFDFMEIFFHGKVVLKCPSKRYFVMNFRKSSIENKFIQDLKCCVESSFYCFYKEEKACK